MYCIADSIQLAMEKLQLSFNALQKALINLKLVLNPIGHTCAFIVFLERGEMAPTAEGLDSEGSDTELGEREEEEEEDRDS